MKKASFKDIFVPVISLLVICIAFTFLLALTNSATADKIEALALEAEAKARTDVLDTAESFSDEMEKDGIVYYEGYDKDGATVGYIFPEQTKGYGGTIYMTVGVNSDGTVHGVAITELSETAGLGMNAKNQPWFLEQYVGRSGNIGVAKNNPADDEIQALTGATITSKAVTLGVNTALESFEKITGGESNG